jgi:hypothetical protein
MEERYDQAIDQAQRVATETADTAASVVSTGALLAFVALVLGAVAGWLGGRSGVVPSGLCGPDDAVPPQHVTLSDRPRNVPVRAALWTSIPSSRRL